MLISSVFAVVNGAGTIPYAMSKAAVEQLGRGLRVELAAHGVSVTTAYFAMINTDMIRLWVTRPVRPAPGTPARMRNIDAVWDGRVVHAVQEDDGWALVEEWLPAGLLDPVRSDRTRDRHGILLGAA